MIFIGLVLVFLGGTMLELPWVHVCQYVAEEAKFSFFMIPDMMDFPQHLIVMSGLNQRGVTKNYFPKIILDINVVNVCLPCERIESE